MDKAYHNINKLGTVIELESTIVPCDITPHHNYKSTETRFTKQLPPHPQVHRVDIVGRIFGGTMRDRGSKIEDKIQKEKESGKKEKDFVFDFGVKNNKKEKENVNPTEKKCTKWKRKTTENIEKLTTSLKAPQKSTKLN